MRWIAIKRTVLGSPCPLGFLGLKVQTERALLAHWVFGGRYVPMVADLVELREASDPDYVPGIGRGRLTEITDKLKGLSKGDVDRSPNRSRSPEGEQAGRRGRQAP
ncbi:hypothetical protein GCM10009550_52600 [Actinocorallia libanotica]|uniref:Uncharacterized protein n=1 Tax=Actinocorallia libanotica TaxID=46162 RepID=A0ABN1RNY2_9ACTN